MDEEYKEAKYNMGDTITIEMDSAQVLWYLEGCARGSHLRQGCWHDMIRLYPDMSQSMRDFLYTYAKRDIAPIFEPQECMNNTRPCGAEDFDQFLACFDKDNRYKVTAQKDDLFDERETYLYRNQYYIDQYFSFETKYITKIEKIEYEND